MPVEAEGEGADRLSFSEIKWERTQTSTGGDNIRLWSEIERVSASDEEVAFDVVVTAYFQDGSPHSFTETILYRSSNLNLNKLAGVKNDQSPSRITIRIVGSERRETEPEDEPLDVETSPEESVESLGATLFRSKCARCHAHLNSGGQGIEGPKPRRGGSPNGGPNLFGFASREWLSGLLDPERVGSDDYSGNTKHADGDMVNFVHDSLTDLDEENKAALEHLVVALSAEASLAYQTDADERARQTSVIERSRTALVETFACTDCLRTLATNCTEDFLVKYYVYKCNGRNHPHQNHYGDWRTFFDRASDDVPCRWGTPDVVPALADLNLESGR